MEEAQLIEDLAVVMLVAGATGWICQKIGLSAVVGYLLAGLLIGPHKYSLGLVKDTDLITLLAQLGLVFLMFFVGLGLSLQRLKRMGGAMAAAVGIGAIIVFAFCRLAGDLMNWPSTHSMFLAAMFMVSSSSIIVKVLEETKASHQRAGQLATGVTVMEDVVAVVMLTLLGSFAVVDTDHNAQDDGAMTRVLGLLTAFVALAVIVGLLFVPRFLAKVSRSAAPEIRTIMMIGLLFGLAWLAIRAGYSSALGAFLLGTIVAETPQKPHIERAFEGLRDMFCAMFFVAIGMMIDVQLLKEYFPMILGFIVFTIVVRAMAVSLGLIASGHDTRDSLRTGLCVTTIGEFSYVIAQLGQSQGLPEFFYPLAVGVSLGTTFAAPFLIRHSGRISHAIMRLEPAFVRTKLDQYSRMLESISRASEANALWRLMQKRVIHVAIEIAVVSGVLIFSEFGYQAAMPKIVEWGFLPERIGARVLFFLVLGILILPALIAIWRNVSALTLVVAEVATSRVGGSFTTQRFFQNSLRAVAAAGIGLWLWNLLPHKSSIASLLLVVVVVLAIVTTFLWRRFVRLHSHIEVRLQESFDPSKPAMPLSQLAAPAEDWNLSIVDFILPENSLHADKTIGELDIRKEFGCSIVGIERQGYPIDYPGPEVRLYPQDKLLVLGTEDQVQAVSGFLSQTSDELSNDSLSNWALETVDVPLDSSRLGCTLEDLSMRNNTGVLIAGIQRGRRRILSPGGKETLAKGDQLLVLGTPSQLEGLKEWLIAV